MHFFGRLGEVVRNPVLEMADQIYHFPSSVNQSQSSEGDGQWKVATYAHLHAIHAPRVMVITVEREVLRQPCLAWAVPFGRRWSRALVRDINADTKKERWGGDKRVAANLDLDVQDSSSSPDRAGKVSQIHGLLGHMAAVFSGKPSVGMT